MFIVVERSPGKGEVYNDTVVLITEDLVKAIDKALAYDPDGWIDPAGWSHHAEWVSVFRHVPEKDNRGDLVYNRQTKKIVSKDRAKRGDKMVWRAYWGDPTWKKAYDRRIREDGWKLIRLEKEIARSDDKRIVTEIAARIVPLSGRG